ncbi:MAG: MoaD/ThiS family protein [Armatimonadetes bacterium]|nr:MoaD/ThiS family protein [Armatimonadota bacterium]
MAIKVEFSEKLRQWVGEMEDMEVSAQTVHQALFAVARAYPALHMFNCEGELRSILRFTRNGQPAKVTDALQDGDTVQLSVGA